MCYYCIILYFLCTFKTQCVNYLHCGKINIIYLFSSGHSFKTEMCDILRVCCGWFWPLNRVKATVRVQGFPPRCMSGKWNWCVLLYKGGAAGLLQHNTGTHLNLLHTNPTSTFFFSFKKRGKKMLNRIFFLCLFLGLYSGGSPLSCRWMDHKFRQYSENSLDLLDTMVSAATSFHIVSSLWITLTEWVWCLFTSTHGVCVSLCHAG